jgi:hypothetical protein
MHQVVLVAASQAVEMPVPTGLWASKAETTPLPPSIRKLYEQPGFWRGMAAVRLEEGFNAYREGRPFEGDHQSQVASFYEKVADRARDYVEGIAAMEAASIEDLYQTDQEKIALNLNTIEQEEREAIPDFNGMYKSLRFLPETEQDDEPVH